MTDHPGRRSSDPVARFIDGHPVFTRLYVPVIVTATLILEAARSCAHIL